MIEGSGSGSIYLTRGSGSGSRRPKIIWIRRIRIRNTVRLFFRECLPSGQSPSIKYDGGNIIVRFPDGEEVGTAATRSDGSGGRTEILQAVYVAVKVRELGDIVFQPLLRIRDPVSF
jgi:hypothetical protein